MKLCQSLFFLLLIQVGFSQNTNSSFSDIGDEITSQMKLYDAVGLAVAIVKEDKVVYSKGFGHRDLEQNLPVTENTVFHIASMTKAFTGSLLGVLESNKQISLKDKPALYLPNFQFYNEKMDNLITIEDLLSHRTGLGNHGSSIVMFPEKDKLKTVQRLKYLKPEGEIKNSWIYSNIGYTVAGSIVEQITGKSWDTNMKEKIFEPLRMNRSFTTTEEMIRSKNYALGYAMHHGKVEKVPFENYYSYTPAGAIKSSVKDLSNWMLTWLKKGVFNGNQVIPERYVYQASRPQNIKYYEDYTEDSFLLSEGFGWRIRSWNGYYRLRHGGNTNGFSSVTELFPFEKIGVVVLCNKSNSTLPYIISDLISRKLLQLPPETEYPVLVSDMYVPDAEDRPFNKAKLPTQAIENFLGTYYSNGYGEIKVTEENGRLFANFPTFKFKLEHLSYNNFFLKGMPNFKESFNPEFTIKFIDDTEGELTTLEIYTQKEPVEFKKAHCK